MTQRTRHDDDRFDLPVRTGACPVCGWETWDGDCNECETRRAQMVETLRVHPNEVVLIPGPHNAPYLVIAKPPALDALLPATHWPTAPRGTYVLAEGEFWNRGYDHALLPVYRLVEEDA